MSYQSQDALTNDGAFQARVRSCASQQAVTFVNDQRPAWVALAQDIIRQGPTTMLSMFSVAGASPGLADKADPEGDGTVDSSLIDDADVLATVQASWPTVADSYYNEDGSPR